MFEYYYKNKLKNIKDIFNVEYPNTNSVTRILFYALLIFILIIFNNFFSTEFSTQKLDFFHEGLALSHGFNSKITGGLWTNSFVQNSLFSEFINPRLAWFISNEESIGSIRVNHIFLRLLTEIAIVCFVYNYLIILNLKQNFMFLCFLFFGFVSIYLNQILTENFYPVRYRDIPIFIFLIFSLKMITSKKNSTLYASIIATTSVFSIFWSLDKGIYINATLLFLVLYLLVKKDYTQLYTIIIFGFFGWLISYILLGHIEFINFLSNTLDIIKNQDLFNGLIYPTPFSFGENEHSGRGTKNLLIIIINGISLSYIIFSRAINLSNNTKAFLILFFILSFINYKGGLSRADGYHMKQSIFPQLLLLISFIIVFCQTYFKEDIFVKNDFHFKWITLLVFLIFNIFQKNLENIKNIFSFKKNYNQYVSLKDSFFIENDYKNLLNKLNNYDINCIQLFSYDSSLPYLLRKKSCTKYNFIYILSSESVQKDLIRELKKKKPEIILANESYPSDILISPHLRFSLVTSYIKDNYIIKEKFKNWIIYEIK